jgi:hypothetical protein
MATLLSYHGYNLSFSGQACRFHISVLTPCIASGTKQVLSDSWFDLVKTTLHPDQ